MFVLSYDVKGELWVGKISNRDIMNELLFIFNNNYLVAPSFSCLVWNSWAWCKCIMVIRWQKVSKSDSQKGTIHLRRRQISRFLTPTSLPSAFMQNAYEGDFWSLCTVTFWPLAHGDTPPPLRHADILNGWSLWLMALC